MAIKTLIAISSGKGGVGKSTIASNFAVALAQTGAAVGLMDADITGPNLPLLMGLEGQRPQAEGEKMAPLDAYGVQVISMGFLIDPDRAIIWRGPMIHQAIRQLFSDVAWGDLDYMIIDLPPGTGDAQLTLAQTVPVSGAVIVTQPQQVALGDARRGISMFRQVDVPILGIVENMSGDFFGTGGGKELAEAEDVPYLGSVPLDPQVRVGGDSGKPIVIAAPDSEAAQMLNAIALEVAKRADEISGDEGGDVIQLRTLG